MFDITGFNSYLSSNAIPTNSVVKTVEQFFLPNQPKFANFTILNNGELEKAKKKSTSYQDN